MTFKEAQVYLKVMEAYLDQEIGAGCYNLNLNNLNSWTSWFVSRTRKQVYNELVVKFDLQRGLLSYDV